MATVRVEVDGDAARVYFSFSYEVLDIVRSFPGRTWHPDDLCWQITAEQVPALRSAVERAGHVITVDRLAEPPTWADLLLGALEPDEIEAVYAALEPVLRHRPALLQQLSFARITDPLIRPRAE